MSYLPRQERIWLHRVKKKHFLRFVVCFRAKLTVPHCTNFEMNGHGAFVWCHRTWIHIKCWNLNNIPSRKRTWLHRVEKNHFLRFFFVSGQNWQLPHCHEYRNKWSWGICVMTLYSKLKTPIHTKWWNLNNIPHQERIWSHRVDKKPNFKICCVFPGERQY